ncbi:hypothetical protein OCF84_20910 (plasmid) [Shewanella xiamenensis]|uniref:Uncharacterized protein n=1 Tax=Shewanella xiamenensis TaxID=332186 RepID=A0ABT6UFM4_9GAMM|nr:hypothetical protein [Shewanella xiamenensis]MDI5833270.1 hypothetical protein [Shewanella xiamenensis]WHF57980.1 hypothetical protein OCF84_20910 [Shewanella xiamenensis]
MEMILIKFDRCDLLVEDHETAQRVKQHRQEIIELYNLTIEALRNLNDNSYSAKLKIKNSELREKFADKFIFGMPFDARSGELYALDKKINYFECSIDD